MACRAVLPEGEYRVKGKIDRGWLDEEYYCKNRILCCVRRALLFLKSGQSR